jgi:hypothetical protein
MSLTQSDLQQVRTVVREELESTIAVRIDPRFDTLEGNIEALNNDIKDIYKMISELQKLTRQVAHFEKYDLEQKILSSYKNIVAIAKEAGVTLPQP